MANNKAMSASYMIFELIMLAIIGLFFMSKASFVGSGKMDRQDNYAQDLARMTEAYYAIPFDVKIEHYRNFSDYDVYLKNDYVLLEPPGNTKNNSSLTHIYQSNYAYVGREDVEIDYFLSKPGLLIMEKKFRDVLIHGK